MRSGPRPPGTEDMTKHDRDLRIVALKLQGLKVAEIAGRLRIHQTTVWKILKAARNA